MPFIDITSAPNFPIVFMVGLVAFVCLSAMCKTSAPAVTCTTPGCNKPTWNGKQGEYCTRGCKETAEAVAAAAKIAADAAAAAPGFVAAPTPVVAAPGALCIHGCGEPALNGDWKKPCSTSCPLPATPLCISGCGKPTGHWGYKCASCGGVAPTPVVAATGPTCKMAGCKKPTYNGKPNEKCGRGCNGFAAPGAPRAPCINRCGKPSWSGMAGDKCTKSCNFVAAPAAAVVAAPAAAVVAAPAVGGPATCMSLGSLGCNKQSWSTLPGDYCSVTCRDAALANFTINESLPQRQAKALKNIASVEIELNGSKQRDLASTIVSLRKYVKEPDMIMKDPRDGKAGKIGVGAFYLPDKEESWDKICSCGFCGNFWNCGADQIKVTAHAPFQPPVEKWFTNTEAAFQALKFWDKADEFRSFTGDQAFQRKKFYSGHEDFKYGGTGSNWKGMLDCLRAKFEKLPAMKEALLETGDLYLVEHNAVPGRDLVWSDNSDGSGTNWLGFQCMLIRDELRKTNSWTNFIYKHIDSNSGALKSPHAQQSVFAATAAILEILPVVPAAPVCKRPGCIKPTWNGQQDQFCGSTCRDLDKGAGLLHCTCCPGGPGASVNICRMPNCGRTTYNNESNWFCGNTCVAAARKAGMI